MRFSLFALPLAFITHSAAAADGDDVFPPQVGMLMEYYEVDHADLPDLLTDYHGQPDGSALLKTLQAMEKDGKSRLLESTYILTRNGQRAKVESIRECVYPTEFDPAEIPQDLAGPLDPAKKIIAPANPGAFEMRPVGNTLEVDPVITGDGGSVELNIAPELVEFHGMQDWGTDESVTPMPLFHSMKSSTSITVKFGGAELIGVHTPSSSHGKKGEGKRVLGLITVLRHVAASRADMEAYGKNPAKWRKENLPEKEKAEPKTVADPFAEGAGDVAPEPPRGVSILTEYIEVSAEMAGRIARQLHGCADATQIRRRLDGAIKAGDARLLEISSEFTRSGTRTKGESNFELSYPSEFDPAEMPQNLKGPIDRGLRIQTSKGATSFEMRPVGCTVEVDPVLADDNRSITINIAPEVVSHKGSVFHGQGANRTEQPLFETLKLSTSACVADGTTSLLAIHSLETARAANIATEEERKAVRDRRVLLFVTAKIKTLK